MQSINAPTFVSTLFILRDMTCGHAWNKPETYDFSLRGNTTSPIREPTSLDGKRPQQIHTVAQRRETNR